jgi:hypothetical protein
VRLALRPGRAVVGVLDETAHLALGLLLARRSRAPVAVVAGSMFIDADHLPSELGHEWLRHGGSGRPYPHALVTLAALALISRAAALGLALHLARDLTDSETGVRLLWPLTNREFKVAPWLYPVGVGALCAR